MDGFQSGCAALPIPRDDFYTVIARLCQVAAQKRKMGEIGLVLSRVYKGFDRFSMATLFTPVQLE